MASSRSNATLLGAVTTSQTSAAQALGGHYGGDVAVSITQVGAATTAASFSVPWSPDGGTTYYTLGPYATGLAAGTYYFTVDIPIGATHIEVVFTQQAGGTSSTCTAQASWVTGI